MNILVVPSWYKSESNPNLGSFFREQAIALTKFGHKVFLLDTSFSNKKDYLSKSCFRIQSYIDNGVSIYSLKLPSLGVAKIPFLYNNIYRFVSFMVFEKFCKQNKIDVIHAHSYYPAGNVFIDFAIKKNIPIVITEHSSLVLSKKMSTYEKKLLIKSVEKSDAFICVSKALRESVLAITQSNKSIHIIPNGVGDIFRMKSQNSIDSDFVFINVANLVSVKRQGLLIDAFYSKFKDNERVKLVIIGEGILKSQLSNQIQALGLSNQIKLRGLLPRERVVEELQRANAFVLTSEYETFNVACIEALAVGLPVISTRCGGPEEFINTSNGILCDVNDVNSISSAMDEVIRNYDKFDQLSISKSIRNKFSFSSVVSAINNIYKNIVTDNI